MKADGAHRAPLQFSGSIREGRVKEKNNFVRGVLDSLCPIPLVKLAENRVKTMKLKNENRCVLVVRDRAQTDAVPDWGLESPQNPQAGKPALRGRNSRTTTRTMGKAKRRNERDWCTASYRLIS